MTRYARLLLAAVAGLAIASPAVAEQAPQPDSTAWLQAYCTEPDYYSHGFCMGYIRGSLQTFRYALTSKAFRGELCVPDSVTLKDVHAVVLRYIRKHPEYRRSRAAVPIALSVSERWPCERPRQ